MRHDNYSYTCKKSQLEVELSSLQKKEHKSKWYFSRKKVNVSELLYQVIVTLLYQPVHQHNSLLQPLGKVLHLKPSLLQLHLESSLHLFHLQNHLLQHSVHIHPQAAVVLLPNIGLSPLTPSSQLTSTPSPRSLSESVGQHTNAISLSTDQGDTTDGIDFLEHSTNEPGYNPVVISSDDEHLTEIQSSPCLDILSSPVSPHFQ